LLGALMGEGTIIGAIFSHLFLLGIIVKNDGGELFILAIITLICCLILVYSQKHKIADLLRFKI